MTGRQEASSLAELKERVMVAIEGRRGELALIATEIHQNPELAFQEKQANRLLTSTITGAGVKAVSPVFGLETAFLSEFGRVDGPCVGLIAEYDALPNLGHACGHNIIGTAALGAALGLLALGEHLPGRVRLLGTPAEETGGGKILMAREGAFDGLACVMMVHPAGQDLPSYPLIARAAVRVTYTGRAAHAAAAPEEGINALDGLVFAYQAVAAWRQHLPNGHRVHGIILEGGTASNVIPDRAVGEFAVRAPDRRSLRMMRQRIEQCFRAGAAASGCDVAIEWDELEYHELITNWPLANCYRRNAEALGRTFGQLESLPSSAVASSDFGNVSHIAPAIHPMIAAVPSDVAFHTPEFARWVGSESGLKAMLVGAKAMAMTALDFMVDDALQEDVKTSFRQAVEAAPA